MFESIRKYIKDKQDKIEEILINGDMKQAKEMRNLC